MLTNVASGGEPGNEPEGQDQPEGQDITGYALTRWDRTARLCAIRLAEALPAIAALVTWLILRR